MIFAHISVQVPRLDGTFVLRSVAVKVKLLLTHASQSKGYIAGDSLHPEILGRPAAGFQRSVRRVPSNKLVNIVGLLQLQFLYCPKIELVCHARALVGQKV